MIRLSRGAHAPSRSRFQAGAKAADRKKRKKHGTEGFRCRPNKDTPSENLEYRGFDQVFSSAGLRLKVANWVRVEEGNEGSTILRD
jgi:hypothetical protein